jgi:predicted Fe-S protein YdhL (DUF1289 family)
MSRTASSLDEQAVASPCVNVCKMNEVTGVCDGCRRNLEEIASWSAYSDAQKRAVLERLPARKIAR